MLKKVVYCSVCSMPPEYCEYHPSFLKCMAWLKDAHPDMYELLYGSADNLQDNLNISKSSRGGKAQLKDTSINKLNNTKHAKITLKVTSRNKRKSVTTIGGIPEADVKRVARRLGARLACGAGVQGNPAIVGCPDEVVLQGDFVDCLLDILREDEFGYEDIEVL